MKVIIIGTSLAGKTTLIRFLRSKTDLPISEMDEELTLLNGGEYPTDFKLKHEVVAPKVISKVLSKEAIIFFTNTDYFSIKDLFEAKEHGFQIIQLQLGLDELIKRNETRMKNEGYDDMGQWIGGMLEYQAEIKDAGLVDEIIDANKPTSEIVEELTKYFDQ